MTDVYEPRQVRKEAAVSKAVCVVVLSTFCPGGKDLPRAELERGCTAKVFFICPRRVHHNLDLRTGRPLAPKPP